MSPASGEDAATSAGGGTASFGFDRSLRPSISAPGAAARSACMTPVVSARRA
jgi:hypothetical protein